jgi:hypothetical protein
VFERPADLPQPGAAGAAKLQAYLSKAEGPKVLAAHPDRGHRPLNHRPGLAGSCTDRGCGGAGVNGQYQQAETTARSIAEPDSQAHALAVWAITLFGSGDDHVTCAGRRIARKGREAVGQDVRRGQSRYLLGERRLPAPGASALEPADLRDHQDPPAAERKVGELTLVAGVNPRRAPAAPGARHVARPRPDPERHHVPAQLDAVYDRGSELRQKRINSV